MDTTEAEINVTEDYPEFKEIADYIEHTEFRKKALGGCDEEDVMQKIRVICEKYESLISRIQKEYTEKNRELLQSVTQITEYREFALQKAREEADTILTDARQELEEHERELARLKKECAAYRQRAEAARQREETFMESMRHILEQAGDTDARADI